MNARSCQFVDQALRHVSNALEDCEQGNAEFATIQLREAMHFMRAAAGEQTAADYTRWVAENWSRRRAATHDGNPLRDLYIMTTGLGGETGEVLELLKKHVRDGVLDRSELVLELGDVLHYVVRIALQFDFTLDEVMSMNVEKLEERARVRGYAGAPR